MTDAFVRIDPPLEVVVDPGTDRERGGAVIGMLGSSFCAIDRTGAVGWLIAPELLVVDPRVQVVAESASKRWTEPDPMAPELVDIDAPERTCVECGEPWPCLASQEKRRDGTPHRMEAA